MPTRAEGALGPYLRAIRAHRLLVALVVAAAVGGSLVWNSLSSPVYEASAQLLVTPVSAADQSFIGVDVIRESPGDQTRTIQTTATLVASEEAADATARALDRGWSSKRVLDAIDVQPQGESNILAVTAEADGPRLAARLANEFARSALTLRTQALQRQAAGQIPRLQSRRRRLTSNSPEAGDLAARLDQLVSVAKGDDPSLSLSQRAQPPEDAIGPPKLLILILAALAGFSVGSGAALLRELLDRRIRDGDEAVALYPLPVLARVPILKRRQLRAAASSPSVIPPPVREAFRTLLTQLGPSSGGRAVMVTSASSGDGKTTTAVNLATAIAATGDTVILLDLDLRKPDLGRMLGIQDRATRLTSLLESKGTLADLLVPAPALPSLSVLSTSATEDLAPIEAVLRRLPRLIDEGRKSADWVIIDTAPLGEVSDALRITQHAKDLDILIVMRAGHTHRNSFDAMRALLERAEGPDPTGLLVIGDTDGMSSGYYYLGHDDRKRLERWRPLSRAHPD